MSWYLPFDYQLRLQSKGSCFGEIVVGNGSGRKYSPVDLSAER